MELQTIAEKYSQLSTEKLIRLTKEAGGLQLEAIPLLQKELLKRGKQDEALALSSFLVESRANARKPTPEEVHQLIQQRLAAGEYLESIQIDLKENGIDIFELADTEVKLKNSAFNYITTLKEEGHDQAEINTKIKDAFAIDDSQSALLQSELKREGNRNLVSGYVLVGVCLLLGAAMIGVGGSIRVGFFLVLGAGVWRICEGYKQRR
jgi:hypothetical protein